MHRRPYLIAFGLLALLYLATQTGNTFEALDGYDYALAAERIPLANTHDTRSILFHKINRVIYLAVAKTGLDIRAYELLRALTCLVGAAAVLLFARLLMRFYGVSRETAWLGAALLASTYGFWRYAGEVEVYIPSIALILAMLNLVADAEARPQRHPLDLVPAGLLGGLTVLYYQPNAIPLFLAMPILVLSRAGFWRAGAYAAAGGAVIIGGISAAFLARGDAPLSIPALLAFINDRGGEFPAPPLSLWSFGQGAIAIAHDLLSTHWLYGIDAAVAWLDAHAPLRIFRFEETIFTARLHRPWVYLPLVLLPALAGLGGWLIWHSRRSALPAHVTRPLLFTLAWFVIHAAIILPLDPGTEEVWIVALVPIVAALSVLVIARAVQAGLGRWVAAAIALTAIHNLVSGLGIYQNGTRDLRTLRSAWLATNARPGDAVLFTEVRHMSFAHLRYRLGLDVLHTRGSRARTVGIDPHATITAGLDTLIASIQSRGHDVFFDETVLKPGRRLGVLEGAASLAAAEDMGRKLGPRSEVVATGPYGRIYRINRDPSLPAPTGAR